MVSSGGAHPGSWNHNVDRLAITAIDTGFSHDFLIQALLMAIEFSCPTCEHPVRTPDSQGGKQGRCPSCRNVFTIPEDSTTTAPAPEKTIRFECQQCNKKLKVPASRADKNITCPQCGATVTNQEIKSSGSLSGILTAEDKIEFPCGECGNVVQTPSSQAGKKGRCPECHEVMQIPVPRNPPRTASRFANPPPPVETPAYQDFHDPVADLGGGPLDQLDDWQAATDNRPVVSSLRPTGGGGGRYRVRGPRKGLPWYANSGQSGAFWETVTTVLFSPRDAFSRMYREGGTGHAMSFAFTGQMVGAGIALGFLLVFGIIALVSGIMYAPESRPVSVGGSIVFGLIVAVVVSISYILLTAIHCLMQCFVTSAFQHVGLTVVRGAYETFETTARVVSYVMGSLGPLMMLTPVIAIPLQVVLMPIYITIGCYAAHETSKGQAIASTLLAFVIWYGMFFGTIVLTWATIWAALTGLLPSG
ncbi:MAG: hypothetical protein ABGX05_06090 [Pirellulaceae bacterium]